MEIADFIKAYSLIGAGGIAFCVLIYLYIYNQKKILPTLNNIAISNAAYSEIIKNNSELIKNNTEAIKEVSKSNVNVANALTLLDNSFTAFSTQLERHDERAEKMNIDIVKIAESTKNWLRK